MTKNVTPVNVNIFGKEYPVACPPGQEDGLRKSAIRVDEEMRRIQESGKVIGSDRIAVIVALNLAYELLKTQQNSALETIVAGNTEHTNGAIDPRSQQRISKIQQEIDAALELYQGEIFK